MSESKVRWGRRAARAYSKALRIAEQAEETFAASRRRLWLRFLGAVAPRIRAELDRLARVKFNARRDVVLRVSLDAAKHRAAGTGFARSTSDADARLRAARKNLGCPR